MRRGTWIGMGRRAKLLTIASLAARVSGATGAASNASADVLQYVDQLIGSVNGGNVFAGASLPYGQAKAVADVSGQNTGGFATDGSNVTGFSHMHDSGTGGNPSLGNFPLFPQLCPDDELDNCQYPKLQRAVNYVNGSVQASPGYFALGLANGITAEMTVTEHAALYHFTFPDQQTGNGSQVSPMMLLDLTDINDSRQNASIRIDANGRMTGNGTFLPSFGSGSFVLHFCADFAGAPVSDTGIFVNSRAGTEPKEIFVTRGINLFYIQAGGFVRFDAAANRQISARVGVSFVSAEQACACAEREIPGPNWDFASIRQNAADAWREKLSVVSIDPSGVSTDYLTLFYTSMYRTMLSPQNYTGDNPLWQSAEPYFDSFYCIWDSFRTQFPFLTLVDPSTVSQLLRSLLDTYKHLGWLPDCRMSLCKGFTQGGSNADIVLADAYIKNITGVDWDLAYEAVVNDAENEPFDWSVEGRGGLMSWKALDYIPALDYDYLGFGTNSRSISRTLEYSYNDYAVSVLADGLGKDTAPTYRARSGNWQNLFKAEQTSYINGTNTGFTGFFQPKYLNGTWGYQDPILCSPLDQFCSLTDNPQETFEDSIWEYQFFVPHDQATLIRLLGGPATFARRLDYLFSSGLADIGNEAGFLTAFLYHYAGRPALSSARLRSFIPAQFNATAGGLPGNDDSGAMASYVAFMLTGLFPNAGQDVYFITAPFFPELRYRHPVSGRVATIRCHNFGSGNIYVQSATLDGQPYTRNWIGHDLFAEGRTLELTLGPSESAWGTNPEDCPPSVNTGTMAL